MERIMSWITALAVMLGNLFGTASPEPEPTGNFSEPIVSAIHEMLEERRETFMWAREWEHADVNYADMSYEHYDPAWFYSATDSLCDLADAGRIEDALALYDELYDTFLYADTLNTIAMLRHDGDFSSEYWEEEYFYTEELWREMSNALSTAGRRVLNSPTGDAFSDHIGPVLTADFADYVPMTRKQEELDDRETELEEEYYELNDGIGEVSFEYLGQTWTLDMLNGRKGENLLYNDYDGYVTVYYGIQEEICRTFAPLFIELTELRTEEARLAGYDNYSDYAYERRYGRDYSTEDAQAFCDAVKPIARRYFDDLYYSDVFDAVQEVGNELDTEELFAAVEGHLSLVDPSLSEPWAYMTEHGLYDVALAGSGRYDGAYTTALTFYGAPFMFVSGEGDCRDLITLTHEFGHYADFYFSPAPDVLSSVSNLDLNEIHSNGLQALFTAFYKDIFGWKSAAAAFMNLADLLENVIDGCMYDEFQRRVFDEADDLTPERVNEIYLDVCLDYGMYDRSTLPDYDAGWAFIGHLFLTPCYYISYAASGFAALQIWDMAQEDFDAATQAYMSVLQAGAYEDGYFDVLRQSGLRSFTARGAIDAVLAPVLEQLARMERSANTEWY